jgi:hypothetical protein
MKSMKPAFFVLLGIYAGASVALAQTAPTTTAVRAPEIDCAIAGSALILLVGVVAIVRGRRSG